MFCSCCCAGSAAAHVLSRSRLVVVGAFALRLSVQGMMMLGVVVVRLDWCCHYVIFAKVLQCASCLLLQLAITTCAGASSALLHACGVLHVHALLLVAFPCMCAHSPKLSKQARIRSSTRRKQWPLPVGMKASSLLLLCSELALL